MTNQEQLKQMKLDDPQAFAATDEIFSMFAGILNRINERIDNGMLDGIGEEAASVRFEDVFDVLQKHLRRIKS